MMIDYLKNIKHKTKNKLNFLRTSYPQVFSFYAPLNKGKVAKQYAKMDKRLDVCAAQIAFMLHSTNKKLQIKNQVCMELGAGWLLTHSIIFYLLGAKKVIATDYTRLAEPRYIKEAINNSYISSIRDILSPFEDHEVLRQRLEYLASIKKWDFLTLKDQLNIDYIAPVDFTIQILDPVDFIFSLSVMEHIPSNNLSVVVRNLAKMIKKGGQQFHFIHLEDHYEANNPFIFLEMEDYSEQMECERGNRIRASKYWNEFKQYNLVEQVYAWKRNKPLPQNISVDIEYVDDEDLRTSHLGLWCKKI